MAHAPALSFRTLRLASLSLMLLFAVKFALYVVAAQPFGGAQAGLCHWDCLWYVHAIAHGYDRQPNFQPFHDFANWAFFPLYIIAGAALRWVTGLDGFWAGAVVSVLSFMAFVILSLRYRALTRPGSEAANWIGVLLCYPFSFYFFLTYTESLYLLVTIVFLLAACEGAPLKAGIGTALLTATRPTGVLALPYNLILCGKDLSNAFAPGRTGAERRRLIVDAVFPVALAPLGIACFMAYLYWLTGDALAFRHVERAWGRAFGNPLKNVYWGLAKNDWANLLHPHGLPSQSFQAGCAVLAGVAILWLLHRRRWLEAWLLSTTLLLAAAVGVASINRYMTANPIFLLAVGDAIDRIPSLMLRLALGAVGLILQGMLLALWMANAIQYH